MSGTVPSSGPVSLSMLRSVFGLPSSGQVSFSSMYQDGECGTTVGLSGLPFKGVGFSLSKLKGKAAVSNAPGMFTFSNYTFTNSGATGKAGPTSAQLRSTATEPWASNSSRYLNVNSTGIQLFTVPKTGNYTITAAGAMGGGANLSVGGKGRIATGTFSLTQGETLKIVVGQAGKEVFNNVASWGGTGGGGSFVVCELNNELLVAGGGGGGAAYLSNGNRTDGWSAPQSRQGTNNTGGFNTATLGNGGAAAPDYPGAPVGGGGGFNGSGSGSGGNSYFSGSTGASQQNNDGGFGGGATAFYNSSVVYTGGGGGYTGGDSANYWPGQAGGAGGSYISTTRSNTTTTYGGQNPGAMGYVSIVLEGGSSDARPGPSNPVVLPFPQLTLSNLSATLALPSYFSDPQDSTLSYFVSSNPKSNVSINEQSLTLTVNAAYRDSSYNVYVSASNAYGLSSSNLLAVTETVAPTPTATSMGSVSLSDDSATYSLSSYFSDTSGSSLSYQLSANPNNNASITAGVLTVAGNNRGSSYSVTVAASNAYAKTAASTLLVTESTNLRYNYPPVFLTGNTSTITGQTHGNGQYVVSVSSYYSSLANYDGFNAFNSSAAWWACGAAKYSFSTGGYVGSTTTTSSGTAYAGEWLSIRLPAAIQLHSYVVYHPVGHSTAAPSTWVLMGSSDAVTWFTLHVKGSPQAYTTSAMVYSVNSALPYIHYRIVVSTNNKHDWTGWDNVRFVTT